MNNHRGPTQPPRSRSRGCHRAFEGRSCVGEHWEQETHLRLTQPQSSACPWGESAALGTPSCLCLQLKANLSVLSQIKPQLALPIPLAVCSPWPWGEGKEVRRPLLGLRSWGGGWLEHGEGHWEGKSGLLQAVPRETSLLKKKTKPHDTLGMNVLFNTPFHFICAINPLRQAGGF